MPEDLIRFTDSPFTVPQEFVQCLGSIEQQASAPKVGTERYFAALDVQEGDRVRLTTLGPTGGPPFPPDAATLEGVVLGIKQKGGESQLRIKGFDHTGGKPGGQHVWFSVSDYKIEVLHRVYRWTDEDRLIVAMLGYTDHAWLVMTEESHERLRKSARPRLAKVKRALGLDA